jgi:hypothetical protein
MGGWGRTPEQQFQYGEFWMDDYGDGVGEWGRGAEQQYWELGVDRGGDWRRRIFRDAGSWRCTCGRGRCVYGEFECRWFGCGGEVGE